MPHGAQVFPDSYGVASVIPIVRTGAPNFDACESPQLRDDLNNLVPKIFEVIAVACAVNNQFLVLRDLKLIDGATVRMGEVMMLHISYSDAVATAR